MSGFTGTEAVKRLAEKTGKVQVQMTALVLMAKLKGKTNKAIRLGLGDNCPSWISKVFTMADKIMASAISSPEKQAEIGDMRVAAAETEVVRLMEAHMTALGVGNSFEKYGKVCHFVAECPNSIALLNPPKDEDKPAEAAPAAETVTEAAPEGAVEAADEPIVGVDLIMRQIEGLSDAELLELSSRLQTMMIERNETAQLMAA